MKRNFFSTLRLLFGLKDIPDRSVRLFQWPLVLLVAQTMQLRADAGYFTGMKWQGSHGKEPKR